jgi:hypothetical protein
LGDLQTIEKEEKCSDIEKKEGSDASKSQTPFEREGVATDRTEMIAKDLHMANKRDGTGSRCDK